MRERKAEALQEVTHGGSTCCVPFVGFVRDLQVGCRKQRVKRCFAALTLGLGCVLGVLCVAQTVRSLVS